MYMQFLCWWPAWWIYCPSDNLLNICDCAYTAIDCSVNQIKAPSIITSPNFTKRWPIFTVVSTFKEVSETNSQQIPTAPPTCRYTTLWFIPITTPVSHYVATSPTLISTKRRDMLNVWRELYVTIYKFTVELFAGELTFCTNYILASFRWRQRLNNYKNSWWVRSEPGRQTFTALWSLNNIIPAYL